MDKQTTTMGSPCSTNWDTTWIGYVDAVEVHHGRRICGARTRCGDACLMEPTHSNGRCRYHGGLEAYGGKGLLAPALRPIYRPACVAGSAVTCEVPPGDNWMIHVAVEQCQAGDVLVVSPSGPADTAYVGDLIATSLQARGVLGVVVDGAIRDIATLTEMRFPVWSRSVCARGPVKEILGNVNVPVLCAGVQVNPGDLIIADDDGVCAVARDDVAAVLDNARARRTNEEQLRSRLENGELALDIQNMRDKLNAKGLRYVKAE